MNQYTWYKIFNKSEFEATGLVSRTLSLLFPQIGLKDILIIKGNLLSVVYDGVILSLNLNTKNPFEFDSKAIYLDENDDVWVGDLIED